VLFLHGFAQSQACWRHQVESPLRQSFRLVTYDNRGHGRSDKPLEPYFYREPRRWADEVDTVIRGLRLDRPVVVAWSYAGRIVLDYLAAYGDGAIAGLVMAAATSSTAPENLGPAIPLLAEMGSEDAAQAEAALHAFMENCTHRPLPPEEAQFLGQESALTPREVRRALGGRAADYDAVLAGLKIPVLAINGAEDRVILPDMAAHTAGLAPRGEARIYPGIGHMPFWEAPDEFNRDLAAFVSHCA
jgi:pimeloyl-ACP methyl ester carboxylesterase